MKKKELEEIATIADLEEFSRKIISEFRKIVTEASNTKEFYSPGEFAEIVGIKYRTILNYCSTGRIRATQSTVGSGWMIPRSEIQRLRDESAENITSRR